MAAIVPPGWEAAISEWDKLPSQKLRDDPNDAGRGGTELIWANFSDWDKISIAGQEIHALASVDTERTQRIQKDTTPQMDGVSTRLLGLEPARISTKLRFFSVRDLSDLGRLITGSLLLAPGKPSPDPVAVSHPSLGLMGIARLFLEGYTTPKVSGPGGTMDVTLRWMEFMPQKDKPTKGEYGKKMSEVDLSKMPQADLGASHKTTPSADGAKQLTVGKSH